MEVHALRLRAGAAQRDRPSFRNQSCKSRAAAASGSKRTGGEVNKVDTLERHLAGLVVQHEHGSSARRTGLFTTESCDGEEDAWPNAKARRSLNGRLFSSWLGDWDSIGEPGERGGRVAPRAPPGHRLPRSGAHGVTRPTFVACFSSASPVNHGVQRRPSELSGCNDREPRKRAC
jgi:hypothetical protein